MIPLDEALCVSMEPTRCSRVPSKRCHGPVVIPAGELGILVPVVFCILSADWRKGPMEAANDFELSHRADFVRTDCRAKHYGGLSQTGSEGQTSSRHLLLET
eukprot:s737_g33.t1